SSTASARIRKITLNFQLTSSPRVRISKNVRTAAPRSRLTAGYSRSKPLAIVPVLEEALLRVGRKRPRHRERHVDVGTRVDQQARKRFRRDADDRELRAVQKNPPADDRRIARELVLPEIRPEHHDRVA